LELSPIFGFSRLFDFLISGFEPLCILPLAFKPPGRPTSLVSGAFAVPWMIPRMARTEVILSNMGELQINLEATSPRVSTSTTTAAEAPWLCAPRVHNRTRPRRGALLSRVLLPLSIPLHEVPASVCGSDARESRAGNKPFGAIRGNASRGIH
jgi:hypothetical protein